MENMSRLVSFDFAIKYLLKDKSSYDIVEGFISAVLQEQGYKAVKIVALLDSESNKEEYSQKKSLADLIVEDEEHNKYIVEIERQEVRNFVHKSCFNTSRLIVDQISSGTDYLEINKVFHISLLYFRIGDSTMYHGKTIVKEVESGKRLSIHIEDQHKKVYDATDIFPEYIFISIPQFDDKIEKEIDEWLYVMKNDDVKPEFKSPYMRRVAERLDVLKMTTEERNAYHKYQKEVFTYKDAIDNALDKGRAEGRAEGEKARSIEIARKLLQQGMRASDVINITGLSSDGVDEIIKSIKLY